MANSYYNHATFPTPNSPGSSAQMRAELQLVTAAFDKLPTLSGNPNKVVVVNAGASALSATDALAGLAITASTINSTPIGSVTPAGGWFTSLSATGAVSLGSNVAITGGTINGTQIGNVAPAAGAFTSLSASSGITGALTGNVVGNVTGNVVGNVTGNVTGNVSASTGTSTFNNVTINGTLDMDAGSVATIINLTSPTDPGDAANKGYVDTGLALKLNLAGGTLSGNLAMGTNLVTGLGAPLNGGDAANKTYVDTQRDTRLALAGGTMSGAIAMGTSRITGLGDPVSAQDAATKIYVDNAVQGLDAKASCRVATTANITLSGAQTIDGVSAIAGDRVLVKNQNTASENGIYVVASGTWARSADANTWNELVHAFVFVEEGTAGANNGYVCTVTAGGTLGSNAVTWVQFSGAGQITAGTGLTKTGNQLDVGTASSDRIVVNADSIDLATTGVVAGTYRSVTVDSYGRATSGTNPTTISGYGITDAYTKTEVDNALALKLDLSGGTLSGAIAMGTNRITGLGDPTNAQDAATRSYVDTGLSDRLALSGGSMSGAIAMGTNKITGMGDPTDAQDAATKNYIDTLFGSTTAAAASAAAALQSELNALASENNASGYASQALTSANNAAASYDAFDDRYLGSKTSDPMVDNDGNALLEGALYWNSITKIMKIYDGANWAAAYLPAAGYLALTGGTMTGDIAFAGTQTFAGSQVSGSISGNAANVTGIVAVANGGTGATTASGALASLGAYPATNPDGYTSNTGTVTSVGGTGTVNGITLTGSVTTSGNLTLGGTLSGIDLTSQVTGTLPVANGGTGITSLGSGVATFLGTPSSANLAAAVTGETGSGALVFGTSPTISGATLNDGYTEEVFAVTGTTPALSPNNGSIQTWTLSGNSTPTAGTWAAGQSITLMVDDGSAFTITWTSLAVTWKTDAGSAPTLNETGLTAIALWKVGTTIYGARVGDA